MFFSEEPKYFGSDLLPTDSLAISELLAIGKVGNLKEEAGVSN